MNNGIKVSVCLASYNGHMFVHDQIASILNQLDVNDELIIGDDASTDNTLEIVRCFKDNRIIINDLKINVGHVKNFELLLKIATGDIIFLSDQDDIWAPGKVESVRRAFLENPDITLVHHALATIDSKNRLISDKWSKLGEGRQHTLLFLMRQLIKAELFGCAIAFKKSIVTSILPFPDLVYAHDHWLGIVASLNGGVYFIDNVLIQYRLHDSNLSPRDGFNLRRIIRSRLKLLGIIAIALVRKYFS